MHECMHVCGVRMCVHVCFVCANLFMILCCVHVCVYTCVRACLSCVHGRICMCARVCVVCVCVHVYYVCMHVCCVPVWGVLCVYMCCLYVHVCDVGGLLAWVGSDCVRWKIICVRNVKRWYVGLEGFVGGCVVCGVCYRR